MAKTPHKHSGNGVALDTALSAADLRTICTRATAENIGDLWSGLFKIVETGSGSDWVQYTMQGATLSYNKFLTFSVTFGESNGRRTLVTEIHTFRTEQTTVMFVPVTGKKMIAHKAYMLYVHKIADTVRGADPSARVSISEGEGAPAPAVPVSPPAPSLLQSAVSAPNLSQAAPEAPSVQASSTPLLPPPPPPPPVLAPPAIVPANETTPAPSPAAQPIGAAGRAANPFLIAPGPVTPVAPPPVAAPVIVPSPMAPLDAEPGVEETRISPSKLRGPSLKLTLDGEEEVPFVAAVLVGRDAAPDPRVPDATLVTVTDSTSSVSKTHAAFETDAHGVWVTDLGSTNGVFVEQPDGTEFDLVPGERTAVVIGSVVSLGVYPVTIERA